MPVAWKMTIQGSRERILDSVLPHEITHTIFATHFGRPLPRWADEGACTTVEHPSEIAKQQQMLIEFLTTNRGIPFNRMFVMMHYPPDMLSIYAQGHSVAMFLIQQGGKQKFVKYLEMGLASGNWNQATNEFYGFRNLSDLQVTWLDWVRNGRPAVQPRILVAANQTEASQSGGAVGQTPPGAALVSAADRGVDAATWTRRGEAASSPTPDHAALAASGSAATTDPRVAAMPRYAPGSTGTVRMLDTSAARPQPIERARQTILEWERPAASEQAN
jgi:hypothetical protein